MWLLRSALATNAPVRNDGFQRKAPSCFLVSSAAELKSSFVLRNFAAAFLLTAASQLPAGWDRPAYAGSGAAATEAAITPSPSTGSQYKIGDQLKITFFEKLDVDADTDADRQRSDRSFHQRMDISARQHGRRERTISIPLLGSVEVAGKDEKAVTEALARPFESPIGRVGLINIVVKEQQPIYIIGPVKTPGVYKYSPGLTVLHAVALAGGFDSGVSDIWHLVEAVRETQTNQTSLDRLKRLLAREAVLRAERDGGEVAVPGRLIDLTSESVAKSLVDLREVAARIEIQLQQTREKTLAKNIDNLKKSIEIRRGRVGFIGDSVDARTSRLNNLRGLQNCGSVTNYVVVQAQSDLADTQDRRQDMLVSISDAEASLTRPSSSRRNSERMLVRNSMEN